MWGRFLRKTRLSARGALLLEALLVIVILAVCLTMIIESMVSGLRSAVLSRRYTQAALAADNALTRLSLGGDLDAGLIESGPCAAPFEDFGCEILSSPRAEEEALLLEDLALKVAWPAGRTDRVITVSTILSRQEEASP